jgi:hypothetical protein
LFSEKGSRPNAPINSLVSAMILNETNNWSYDELMDKIEFDIPIKIALGLRSISERLFSRATIFNFQNTLSVFLTETGIMQNLIVSCSISCVLISITNSLNKIFL